MRKSFKLLLTLALCLVTLGMKAADVTGALGNVADPTITYKSVDANNKEITLSAKLYYKTDKPSEFVVLNCHPTITHNDGCPTGSDPQMGAIKYMTSEYALVICPDYIGFGDKEIPNGKLTDPVHPYMCATLTARNLLDCYKAAVKYYNENSKKNLSANYYTLNIGYSQGGATALAFQKYMETQATDAEKQLVNLQGSVCGAGPYDQNMVLDFYESQTTLDYPVYMYYILRGHKEAFGKTTMRNLKLEECFTPEFWAYCKSTLKDTMDKKEKNVDDINAAIKAAGFTTFRSIMNEEYFDHTSKVYRTIRKTLDQSNLLKNDGWTPTAPIVFYHDKKGNDKVIPYKETETAMTRFAGNCTYVDAIDNYGYDIDYSGWFGAATTKKDNYLWHPAIFRETWGDGLKNVGQETIKTLAGITGNESYKFSDLNHRTFGARFYAQFLAKRSIMRPNGKNGTGNANTTNLDIATPNNQDVAADASSVAGNFDVIKTAMPYAIPAEKGVFVQFPAKVDGYYFGCDAPRYKATLNDDGEVTAYEEMQDNADFEANEVYYVVSENEETEPIVSMTAGITTSSVASGLAWRELNIRKLNLLNGKGYATAYMPFAYSSSIAYIGEDAENYIIGKSAESIATGTGAILVNEGTDDTTILEALVDTPEGGEKESCLSGTYTSIPNNDYLTFGRNKANPEEVGFFAYTGSTIKPYSCYYTGSANAAKVLVLNGEETAINSINKNENTEIFTINGTRTSQLQKGINLVRRGGETVKLYIK